MSAAELPGLLRRARIDGAPVPWRMLRLSARGARVTLDGHNGVAEIDGALTLSAAARRVLHLGAVFPLARPLPPMTLSEACAALPLFVDAWVQQATLLTADGDTADTPCAPRAAMGPSLLGALCSRPPLAIALRARVRVMLASHGAVRREQLASTRHVAARVCQLLDEGRAFSVDAFGTSLLVLGGASLFLSGGGLFAHEGNGRRASFSRALSLVPGDVDAMTRALDGGGRVVATPFMGRCGALVHLREALGAAVARSPQAEAGRKPVHNQLGPLPATRACAPPAVTALAPGVAALTSSWVRSPCAQESA